ncbi:hypothetical protein EDD15DRAFT_2370552 [Pisolithus albus]|nr:hypothetical protein EDD15DRAFT_2370552 [Pisolithus albus]
MDLAMQLALQLTPFANIRAMDDYADVLRYILDYWEWDIDAYRTYLKYAIVTTPFASDQQSSTQSKPPGLTPEELRQRIYAMGHRTFAILAAIPRLGVIIIHNMEIIVIADSPVLALGLVVASMFPTLIFPLVLSGARGLRLWITNRWRQRHEPERDDGETIIVTTIGRSETNQTVPVQPIIDEVEVSHRHNGHLQNK